MEWTELIEFVSKQLLVLVVFLIGFYLGYLLGTRDAE